MGVIVSDDPNPFIGEAAADLSTFQHFFVKLDTGGKIASIATGGENPLGVQKFDDADATGKAVVVQRRGSLLLKAGTPSGKPGDLLELAASGKVVKHTEGTGTRVRVVAMAAEDYTTGDLFVAEVPAPFSRGEL